MRVPPFQGFRRLIDRFPGRRFALPWAFLFAHLRCSGRCATSRLAIRAPIIVLIVALYSPVFAQSVSIDPPVADRPEDFSNIVGKYTIKVTVEPTEVHVEQPITLRIYITGRAREVRAAAQAPALVSGLGR